MIDVAWMIKKKTRNILQYTITQYRSWLPYYREKYVYWATYTLHRQKLARCLIFYIPKTPKIKGVAQYFTCTLYGLFFGIYLDILKYDELFLCL